VDSYHDARRFYAYYGDACVPALPWEAPDRLASIARRLDAEVGRLRKQEAALRTGRQVLAGGSLGPEVPSDVAGLTAAVDQLRRERVRLERAILVAESRTPHRLREAIDFYQAITAREVVDPPTFLEWNTWRVFLALDHAREITPNLSLDDDLQPLSPAPGNQPDLEVDFGEYVVTVEVTLRSGADQRQAEARPVTRHVLDAQRRHATRLAAPGRRTVYGLFVAPRIHPDTAADFYVALRYRVIERQEIAVIPLTLRQFVSLLRPFGGQREFAPEALRQLLDDWIQAAFVAESAEDWIAGIDRERRRWLLSLGAEPGSEPQRALLLPLPLG
jgi:hypothetical protein